MEESSLEALVDIGRSFTLSETFSLSYGELIPLYVPPPLPPLPVESLLYESAERKLLFNGLNLFNNVLH
jgi:hypothetical protein